MIASAGVMLGAGQVFAGEPYLLDAKDQEVAAVSTENSVGEGEYAQGETEPADDSSEDGTASTPEIHSLVDALRQAYLTSPSVLAERLRKRADEFGVAAAGSKFGPTISYEVRNGFESDNTQDTLLGQWHQQSGWSSLASAILSQPIYTFGRNSADLKTARAQSDYSRASLQASEQSLLLDTITAYAAVIRNRRAVEITEDYVGKLERELSDNTQRFRKREVALTDVAQAGTRLELAREQLFNARRSTSSSEADFILATGARPGHLEQPNPLTVPVQTLKDAFSAGEKDNPVIDGAYARELVSRARVDFAKAEFLPRVDLRGQAEIGAVTPYSNQYRQRRLTAQVVISGVLFSSGRRMAQLHEAEARNDADWRLIDAAIRQNHVEIADAWNLWKTQDAAAQRLNFAVDSAKTAYDGALLQEKAGLRSSLEVLDLARDLFTARLNHNSALATSYVAQARLLAAIGYLSIGNLLPEDRDLARIANQGSTYQPTGSRTSIPPVLFAIDSLTADRGAKRTSRDPARSLIAPVASTRLELSDPTNDR
jgi:TolC family type I secretion outer membrane protein